MGRTLQSTFYTGEDLGSDPCMVLKTFKETENEGNPVSQFDIMATVFSLETLKVILPCFETHQYK